MANEREVAVADLYEEDGWRPIRGGWPDWLFVDVEDDEIQDFVCVEVKSPTGRLRYNQKVVRRVLAEELGAEYRVEVVE